jgi:nondiscriminating glutamyl-tRNA synthetase
MILAVMNEGNIPGTSPSPEQAAPDRVAELAWGYFADRLPAREAAPEAVREWFAHLVELFVPSVDQLEQLPAKAAFIFGFDPDRARADEENAAVLSVDSARTVLAEFAGRVRAHAGQVGPEDFKAWMNEIKAATGARGKELLYPVRIAITGAHPGCEFDKLLPLIEDGAALGLGIPSVAERVKRFVGA